MSLSYNFFELLKKHQADKSNNGVVGNKGKKIPMTPNTSDMIPNNVKNIFISFHWTYAIRFYTVNCKF